MQIGEVCYRSGTPSLRRNYPVQVQRVFLSRHGKSDPAPRGRSKNINLF